MTLSWLALASVLLAPTPRTATSADPARYALLIGANRGNADEQPLRYAVADAQEVGRLLVQVGGFAPEAVQVLEGPSAREVEEALARINRDLASRGGSDSMLLVFYSGHADAHDLHLGGTLLPWKRLQRLADAGPAKLRLLILDACRSGALTRAKGLRLDEPFALPARQQLPTGSIILASAAANEIAQESDELRRSVFTHHLLSALRGAGDSNDDGVVTLQEAYSYTAHRTVATTSASMGGVQHPTYALDLRGHVDVVLSRPRVGEGAAAVHLGERGRYMFFEQGALGPLAMEATIDRPRTVWLPRARYFVQRRTPREIAEGYLDLTRAGRMVPATLLLSVVEGHVLAQKGSVEPEGELGPGHPMAVSAWGSATAALLPETGWAWGGGLSLERRLGPVVGELRGMVSQSRWQAGKVSSRITEQSLALGARVPLVGDVLALGGRLGGAYLRQSYQGTSSPPGHSFAAFAEPGLYLGLPLGDRLRLAIEGGARLGLVPQRDGAALKTLKVVRPWVATGIGMRF